MIVFYISYKNKRIMHTHFNSLRVSSKWQRLLKSKCESIINYFDYLPSIFEMFELCISGHAFNIFRLSSLAQIMNAFIGRLIWGASVLSFRDCLMILAPNIFASIKDKHEEVNLIYCPHIKRMFTLIENEIFYEELGNYTFK